MNPVFLITHDQTEVAIERGYERLAETKKRLRTGTVKGECKVSQDAGECLMIKGIITCSRQDVGILG
jgi:hypothetical protein